MANIVGGMYSHAVVHVSILYVQFYMFQFYMYMHLAGQEKHFQVKTLANLVG